MPDGSRRSELSQFRDCSMLRNQSQTRLVRYVLIEFSMLLVLPLVALARTSASPSSAELGSAEPSSWRQGHSGAKFGLKVKTLRL
jgi:hypothetical protein